MSEHDICLTSLRKDISSNNKLDREINCMLQVAADSVCVVILGLPLEEVTLSPDALIQSKIRIR